MEIPSGEALLWVGLLLVTILADFSLHLWLPFVGPSGLTANHPHDRVWPRVCNYCVTERNSLYANTNQLIPFCSTFIFFVDLFDIVVLGSLYSGAAKNHPCSSSTEKPPKGYHHHPRPSDLQTCPSVGSHSWTLPVRL